MMAMSPPASLPLMTEVPTALVKGTPPRYESLDATGTAVYKNQIDIQTMLFKESCILGHPVRGSRGRRIRNIGDVALRFGHPRRPAGKRQEAKYDCDATAISYHKPSSRNQLCVRDSFFPVSE